MMSPLVMRWLSRCTLQRHSSEMRFRAVGAAWYIALQACRVLQHVCWPISCCIQPRRCAMPWQKVMQKRRVVWPNDGFMRALIVLEIETFGVASITIEEWIAWGDYDDSLHLLSSSATSGEGRVNASLSREGRQELARFASCDASKGSKR